MEEEFYELDENVDNLEDVKRKLKVENGGQLTKDTQKYLLENKKIHEFLKFGKFDVVDFLLGLDKDLLRLKGAGGKILAEISWERCQYEYLVILLERDSEFPKDFDESEIVEGKNGAIALKELVRLRNELHGCIRDGNLQSVTEISKHLKCKQYLNTKNQSALAVCVMERKLEAYAYILSVGADFKDYEEKSNHFPEGQEIELVKSLLDKHCEKAPLSHLQKVLRKYRVVGKRTNEVTKQLNKMFERMNGSKHLSPLLQVMEYGKYSISFDLHSEFVERICIERREEEKEKNYGIVLPWIKRCYIGAKHCCSSDPEKRNFVYSTLAHELCHLVAALIYENKCLPFEIKDNARKLEYCEIVNKVRVEKDASDLSTDETQIKKLRVVFIEKKVCYSDSEWIPEVIARCAEILAYYGDEVGTRLMEKYLPDLLKFFVKKFIPDCMKFAEEAFLMEPDSVMYKMSKYNGCLTKEEREEKAIKGIDFEDKLLKISDENSIETVESGNVNNMNLNVYILRTNNVFLCKLHVYQRFKKTYKSLVNRKCLFYGYKYFNENINNFREPLRWEPYENVIIVQDDEMMSDFEILVESLGKIESNGNKKVIFIVNKMFERKEAKMSGEILSFDWYSLPGELLYRLESKKVKFQGSEVTFRDLISFSHDQIPELLSKVMAGEPIGDDGYSKPQYFDENMFIKRHLIRNRLDDLVGQMRNCKDKVFVTGIKEYELIDKGFQKSNIKRVSTENCKELNDEVIFLPDEMEYAGDIFQSICEKIKSTNRIHWIHFMKNDFYYLRAVGSGEHQLKVIQEEVLEDELVNETIESKTRVILIVDEPGSGKSTILLKLSNIIKEKTPSTWVIMRSFKEIFSGYEKNEKLKIAFTENDGEVFIDTFIDCICKLDLADKQLLKVLIKKHFRVSIFLDGFDELASKHKSKAIHFVNQLRKCTEAQIWVTSRTSHSEELFVSLETLPYSLKLWSDNEQCRYLCKLWCKLLSDCDLSKANYKVSQIIEATNQCQEVAISDLNLQLKNLLESDEVENSSSFAEALKHDIFYDVATYLLKKAIFTKDFKFLGIPLHVYMVGNVLYSNNFVYVVCANAFSLFSEFVKHKIDIFLREKCRLDYEIDYCKEMARREEKRIEKIHKKIAKHTLVSGSNDYLSPEQVSDLKNIGLVKVKGSEYVFFHKTVEEYFLSASVLEDMENGNPDGELLSGIIVKREWSEVAILLNGALERKLPETRLKPKFFDDFNLRKTFKDFCSRDFTQDEFSNYNWIWKYVILNLESQENELMTEKYISYFKYCLKSTREWNGLKLLMFFEKEKWIIQIFDIRGHFLNDIILKYFIHCSTDDFDLIFRNIEYYISMKSNCSYCKGFLHEGGECSERHSANCSKERLLHELFSKKDRFKINLAVLASWNEDPSVLEKSIVNAKRLIGGDYIKFMKAKGRYGQCILHCSSVRKARKMKTILELLEYDKEMIISKSNDDTPDLWSVIQYWESDGLNEFLDNVRKALQDDELYKNLLFVKNKRKETILHYVLRNSNYVAFDLLIQEAFKLLNVNSINGREEFFNWIEAKDSLKGYNIATWAAKSLDKNKLKEFFEHLRGFLNDDEKLVIIICEGILLRLKFQYYHQFDYSDCGLMVFDYILSLIPDDHYLLKDLLKKVTRNLIYIYILDMDSRFLKIVMEKLLESHVLELHELRELLFEIDKKGNTILHNASENQDDRMFDFVFDEILKLCDGDEDKLRILIMKVNHFGHNIVTVAVGFFSNSEKIANLIEKLKNSRSLDLCDMRKLFSNIDKSECTILHSACQNQDRNVFHLVFDEVIKLFNEDKQELKKIIMKADHNGRNLITLAILYLKKMEIAKLIEALEKTEVIDLNDMGELLLAIDSEGKTILHHVNKNSDRSVFSLVFDEIAKLNNEYKQKFKSIIMKTTIGGCNIITDTVCHRGSEELENLIEGLKKTEVIDSDAMRELFLKIDKSWYTVLHLACLNHNDNVFGLVCDEIVQLFNGHDEELKAIIRNSCQKGRNFITYAVNYQHTRELASLFEELKKFEVLDTNLMKELFLRIDVCGNTVLHLAVENQDHSAFSLVFQEVIKVLKEDEQELKSLIMKANRGGYNIITDAVTRRDSVEFANLIDELKKVEVVDTDAMRELFLGIEGNGRTILHLAVGNLDDIVFRLVCVEVIKLFNGDKQVLKGLIMKADHDGDNIITHTVRYYSSDELETLINELKKTEAIDLNDMRELFLAIDKEGNTVFHQTNLNTDRSVFSLVIEEIIQLLNEDKKELKSLIMKANHSGYNIITDAVRSYNTELLATLIEELKEIDVIDSDAMRKLFLGIDGNGSTILHLAVRNQDNSVFSLVCDEILKLFNEHKEELMSLIMKRNHCGYDIITDVVRRYHNIEVLATLIDELKKVKVLDIDAMRKLFLGMDENESTILHLVVRNQDNYAFNMIFDEIIKLFNGHKEELMSLIMKSDNLGKTLLHSGGFFKINVDLFVKLRDFIGKERMKELLLRVDKKGRTCLHEMERYQILSLKNGGYEVLTDELKEKLLLISEWIGRSEMEKLILSKDENGSSFYKHFCDDAYFSSFLNKILSKETLEELTETDSDKPCLSVIECMMESESQASSDEFDSGEGSCVLKGANRMRME